MNRLLGRWWPALSGWVALAATALPEANPLRVAVVAAFLVVCPGLAVVRLVQPIASRQGRPLELLERAVLTVALSLSLDVLVAEAFYLGRSFTVPRAVAALAVLTTLITLLAIRAERGPLRRDRRRRPPEPAEPERPPEPDRRTERDGPATAERRSGRRGRSPYAWRRGGGLLAAGLLAATAACGGTAVPPTEQPTPGADLSTPTAPGAWRLMFEDQFPGTRLDHANWTTCYDWNDGGCTNAGNHELEWYLPSQVKVADGAAHLTAQRKDTKGTDGKNYPWASGMISTGRDSWNATPRHTFTYGYFAAAIQVPDADSLFPAFWLMPDTRKTPPELDIAEFISNSRSVQMTVHWTAPDGSDTHQDDRYGPVDFPSAFHVFAIDWEPDSLTWYVDGVQRFRVTDAEKIPHVPMEVLINLAVGYPVPPPSDLDSATMKVEWVRVWQH